LDFHEHCHTHVQKKAELPAILVISQQKAEYLVEKNIKSKYNFKSFNGFMPDSDPNLMFSTNQNRLSYCGNSQVSSVKSSLKILDQNTKVRKS